MDDGKVIETLSLNTKFTKILDWGSLRVVKRNKYGEPMRYLVDEVDTEISVKMPYSYVSQIEVWFVRKKGEKIGNDHVFLEATPKRNYRLEIRDLARAHVRTQSLPLGGNDKKKRKKKKEKKSQQRALGGRCLSCGRGTYQQRELSEENIEMGVVGDCDNKQCGDMVTMSVVDARRLKKFQESND
jgi:hypothetical protein